MLTTSDVAKQLKMSEQHIRTILRKGDLKAKMVGKQWIIHPDAVEKYIDSLNIAIEPDDHPNKSDDLPDIIALSFFSGAMGLDIGLSKGGIEPILACEFNKYCRMTINANEPDIALIGDITEYTSDKILEFAGVPEDRKVDVVVGGPPCQAFSSAGNRKGFDDSRGNVFLTFIDRIVEILPTYAIIENVRGLLSSSFPYSDELTFEECVKAGFEPVKGGALLHILRRLREAGYTVSFELYNAANFGAPQVRERIVMIAYHGDDKVGYLTPTHSENGEHGLPKWETLRSALDQLPNDVTHNHIEFPEKRLKYYRMLKEGQNWRDLPPDIQKEAMGKSYYLGGGKTGFLRRLAFDKPSPTLVTHPAMPATDLCHPVEYRPLSVEEYKVIQGFPLDWQIHGSILEQYKQIGNAVPIKLGEAIAKKIIEHMNGKESKAPIGFKFSRYNNTDEVSWERETRKRLNARAKQLSWL
ncbi:MAG: DNA cytosine methyltransferase [Saccharofermentanales bacterium]